MKAIRFALLLTLGGLTALVAQAAPQPAPELQALNVSAGKWVFHGTAKNGRTGAVTQWTWNEDCSWSPNHLFLQCTFDNVWNGRPIQSLVVDTYNTTDKAYWHWEMYAGGQGGAHPFAAKMDIQGDTWTEYTPPAEGKPLTQRIVYKWEPAGHVHVTIEHSTDGTAWTAVDEGDGVRQ